MENFLVNEFKPKATQSAGLEDLGLLISCAHKVGAKVASTVKGTKGSDGRFVMLQSAEGKQYSFPASSKLEVGASVTDLHLFRIVGQFDENGNQKYLVAKQGNMVVDEWI